MPPTPEPKRPDNDDTIGLILGAIIGFVLFTLLGGLIRRPILLAVVMASLFGLYKYSQVLLHQDAVREAITWRHSEANLMNDPNARRVLNSAAKGLSTELATKQAKHRIAEQVRSQMDGNSEGIA